jgi:hypothetical protein
MSNDDCQILPVEIPTDNVLMVKTHGNLDEETDKPPSVQLHTAETKPSEKGPSQPECIIWNWWWEALTWFIGSTAFAILIVLLAVFRDQALTQWKSNVQITTIVAGLAQFAQSALLVSLSSCIGQLKWIWFHKDRSMSDLQLFDDASRGPEGSFRLISRLMFQRTTKTLNRDSAEEGQDNATPQYKGREKEYLTP